MKVGIEMFEKMKQKAIFREITLRCGCNANNPSLADKLIYTIIPFSIIIQNKAEIFCNKYVQADCAIACLSYILHSIYEEDKEMELMEVLRKEQFMAKLLLAINFIYKLDDGELKKLYKNRMESIQKFEFDPISKNLPNFVEEVSYLVAHDLHYNKYVEFNSTSPLMLTGIFEQYKRETAVMDYFKVIIPMIEDALKSA